MGNPGLVADQMDGEPHAVGVIDSAPGRNPSPQAPRAMAGQHSGRSLAAALFFLGQTPTSAGLFFRTGPVATLVDSRTRLSARILCGAMTRRDSQTSQMSARLASSH
jgi:hypothetical protein